MGDGEEGLKRSGGWRREGRPGQEGLLVEVGGAVLAVMRAFRAVGAVHCNGPAAGSRRAARAAAAPVRVIDCIAEMPDFTVIRTVPYGPKVCSPVF